MRKYLFYLLLSILPLSGFGQLLTEGFEGATFPPGGWTHEFVTGTSPWTSRAGAAGGGAVTTAHGGSLNASFQQAVTNDARTKLVTSSLNLTGKTNAKVSFWYATESWFGDINELRVYYKTSAGGTWTLIPGAEYTTSVAAWTQVTLDLPSSANVAAYSIAFEGYNVWGRGLVLDDVVVTADDVVVPPTGCLTAPWGAYPTAALTIPCTGGYQLIADDCYAGEYSRINVVAGTEYSFKGSIASDFLTISNGAGTTVYASGTGEVTWTATATEIVRFYTHADSSCTASTTSRARAVKCGTPTTLSEPTADCFQGDGGLTGFENAYGVNSTGVFRVADDFVVEPGTEFTLEEITLNMYSAAAIGNVTINVRADNAGVPGAVVNTVTMAATSSTNVGTAFGLTVYKLVFDLATPFELTEGTYWIEPTTTTAVYWEMTTLGDTGADVHLSADSGATWVSDDSGFNYQAVFFVAGVCEDVVTGPEGCLTATHGVWPTATFTPAFCAGYVFPITTAGYAGEYSNVQVTAGVEYTFSSSVATDFITIGNAAGTVVLTSGVGAVTWTADADQVVRFYTHVDDECTEAEVSRTRSIVCGTETPVEEPDFACFQGDGLAGNGENGYGIVTTSLNRTADDFIVAEGTFTVEQITLSLMSLTEITSVNINIYADNAGAIGAVEETISGIVPTSQEIVAGAFGYPVRQVVLDLPTPIELEAGTYWLSPDAVNTGAAAIFWEVTSTGTLGAPVWRQTTTVPAWTVDANGMDAVFFISGTCETSPPAEGCLEAENGQWPSAAYTPECSGEAEDITTAAWTGEYSMVTVTSGVEYIFSVSDATYFITIGDEAGETVLASGTGSVTWTSNVSGNVRFYTHFDSDCNWDDETFLTRTIQCGEVIPPTEYCEPVLDCTDGDVINNVTFAGINNDSNCSPNGYGDYTAIQANVEAGETYSMSVTVGSGWTYESTMVWIDFNNDFIFDPVTEYFFIGSDPGTTNTADITIPAGTANGEYRLRVRVGAVNPDLNDLSILACDEDTVFGETEDYTLVVGEGGPSPDCEVAYEGTFQDGLGNLQALQVANDFTVAANTEMHVDQITVNIFGNVATTSVYIYEDASGIPGTLIGSHEGLTPTSQTLVGTAFGFNIYEVVIDLPTSITAPAGIAWVGITTTAGSEGVANYWEAADATTNAIANVSTDGGFTWAANSFGQDGAFVVAGTCEQLGISDMDSFDFAYYPNPVKDELNITSQKVVQSVSVYNLAGQQVSTQKLNVTNGKVSTSSLAPGVYVFRAVLDDGQVETFKVIKK